MRELAEFTQYRRRFKPFGKLKEQNIDDILAAFENKGEFTLPFLSNLVGVFFE